MSSLKDRINQHAHKFDYELPDKLPVITIVNGRAFSKLTSLLPKPFCTELAQCFGSALLALMREIEGAIFGYAFNDEVMIISRNDQSLGTQPWLNNNVQKIASISSSIATLHFNNFVLSLDLIDSFYRFLLVLQLS